MKTLQTTYRHILALAAALRAAAPADRILPCGPDLRYQLATIYAAVEGPRLKIEMKKAEIIARITGGKSIIDGEKEPDKARAFGVEFEALLSVGVSIEFVPIPRVALDQFVLPIPHLAALLAIVE